MDLKEAGDYTHFQLRHVVVTLTPMQPAQCAFKCPFLNNSDSAPRKNKKGSVKSFRNNRPLDILCA